jgi:serine/threonine-protein kinase
MVGKDGMTLVYVPEGKFLMGSKDTDVPSLDNERPQRLVNLDAFWIDATEVTNKQYRPCIDAQVCSPKVDAGDDWRIYNNDSKYDDYPAVFVDWKNASAYCEWVGRRLPTEAEWEKAARGTDGQIYPWGSGAPNNDLLNYNGKINFPTAVKSYPDGVSPYGAYDMAGNVLEWVSDWYSDAYYSIAPLLNPLGPESGTRHIGRGGSNNSGADVVRSAYRFHVAPNFFGQLTYNDGGFRCALSAK